MTDITANGKTVEAREAAHQKVVDAIRPAPFTVKALNGFNGAIDNLLFIAYELFILFYYSQVLGLSATLAGIAILISMVVDAITDPIIGTWSDNLRSRFGRRHAFMFGSIIPIALSFWLLFSPPSGMGDIGLFIWLTVLSVAVRVAVTFYAAPASAVVAEISPLKGDRAEMGIYRQIVAAAGQFTMLWVAFDFFFNATEAYPNGQENPDAYSPFALVIAISMMVFMVIGSSATWRRIQEFEATLGPRPAASFNLLAAMRDWLKSLVQVPNFRIVFIGLFFATLMGSTYRATAFYFGTYLWELTPDQIQLWQQIPLIGMFIMAVVARFIIPHVDPKHPYLLAIGALMLMMGLPALLTALGMMPPPGDPMLFNLLIGANAIVGASSGVIMICSAVMFAETTDEYHFITRVSQTGMIFGLITFGNKVASGAGKVVAGGMIDLVDFPDKEAIETLTRQTLDNLAFILSGFVFIAGITGLAILSRYSLSRKRHAEVLAGIKQMREQSEQQPAPTTQTS